MWASNAMPHTAQASPKAIARYAATPRILLSGCVRPVVTSSLRDAFDQKIGDVRRGELADVAAQYGDFLDKPRSDGLMPRIGHKEHGFDIGVQPLVHPDHLELVLEIGNRAQAPHDHAGANLLGEFDQQGFEFLHCDGGAAVAGQRRGFLTDDFEAFLQREDRRFGGIGGDTDDELIHQLHGAADDVDVAQGQGIEGAGIKPDAFLASHATPRRLYTAPWYSL